MQETVAGKSRDDASASRLAPADLKGASLENLVSWALTNRPSMVDAALAVKDARLALRQLRADAPVVSATPWNSLSASASAGYDALSSSQQFGHHDWDASGDPSLSVSIDVLLWDFGRYDARSRAAAEAVLTAEQAHLSEGYSVFEEVSGAYFSLLEKRALLEVAYTNEFEYAVQLQRAESLVASGEAKQLDLLRARLDLAQAKERVVNSTKDVESAGAEMLRALGIEGSAAGWRAIVDPMKPPLVVFGGFPDSRLSAGDAFSFARTNAPSMRIARAMLRAESANVDYAVSDLLPEITASTSLNWTDPMWVWRWGVGIFETLFQGGRKVASLERATVSLERASSAVDRAEQELSVSIQLAVAERDNARAAIKTSADSLRQASENLELVKRRYDLGDANRVDYTEAVAGYVEALGTRITSFYGGQRAEAAIFRLLGVYPVYDERWIEKEGNP